jgi:hypothetical protein
MDTVLNEEYDQDKEREKDKIQDSVTEKDTKSLAYCESFSQPPTA